MTDRARALFFVFLALIVGELALPGGSTTAITDEAAAPVLEPVQVHYEPHPASYGARSWLPDRRADRLVTDAPCAPWQPTSPRLFPVDFRAADLSRLGSSADALYLLPPSRAPPALS